MTLIVHVVAVILLLLGHGLFLFRGLALGRKGSAPKIIDKIARAVSHVGLPAAIITGFLVNAETRFIPGRSEFVKVLHLILGVLPIIAILAFTPFLSLRRRIPWLLPAVNLLFIAAAAITGIVLIGTAGTGGWE